MNKEQNSNKPQSQKLNIAGVSSRLISETILKDENLKWLYEQKAKVRENIAPKIKIVAGYAQLLPIDENEHPLLKSINSHIEQRIEQIKQSFHCKI